LKGSVVIPSSVVALLLAAVSVTGAEHCSSPTNGGAQFVGTWSCPQSLSALGATIIITENLDDSLTLSTEADAGGGDFCPTDLWTYSGTTAKMPAGLVCPSAATPGATLTVNSFELGVAGNNLLVSGSETLITGDSNNKPVKQTITLSGECKKQ
jgi:hypothetical protein